jgi:uncharacterized membrane protein
MNISTTLWLTVSGIALLLGIMIILFYGYKMNKRIKELHEEDGLYDVNYYWQKAALYWLPFYIIIFVGFIIFGSKLMDSIKNLFVIVNVLVMFVPARIIQAALVRKNKDKIRPKQPIPAGAKIINGIFYIFSILYITYQVYIFVTGKS